MATVVERWRAWPAAHKRSVAAVGIALVAIAAVLGLRALVTDAPLSRLRQSKGEGVTTYEGSWYFPRGGPYVVGFESARGSAQLFLDGRPLARGRGQQLKRVVRPAGVVAVRLVAPAKTRLLWHPPGRRGPPEYVPPSSLSPDTPDVASFSRPGRSLADGIFALLIVLIISSTLGYLWRDSLRRLDRRIALAFAAVFAFALVVRLIDLNGAGQTWDEDVNWSAGRNYVTNLLSLDFSQSSWRWNYEHPPVMKYVAGIGAQLADGYGPARALSALLVALACGLLVPIGRRLFSLRAGVLAGVIAALSPHLIAHSKIVGHEAPTVLLSTLLVWLCLRAHDPAGESAGDPDRRTRQLAWRFAGIGVVLGIAIMSRFVNVLLAPLIGGVLLVQAPSGERKKTFALGLAIIPLVAIAVSLLIWPRLWSTPIDNLTQSWNKLKNPHSLEPFLGKLTNTPPRHYFLVYLWATAPVGVLVGMVAWLARVAVRREQSTLVLKLWLIVPLLVLLSPVRQDGVRYIMPCLMALAVIAAGGIDFVVAEAAKKYHERQPQLFAATAGALGLYLAIACVRVHPYYLDYYNELYGGPAGVARRKAFEIAWWGEGLHEAVGYINRHARPKDRVFKAWVEPGHLAWLRGDLWATEARSPHQADWILVYRPSWKACGKRFCEDPPYRIPSGFSPAYRVSVQGAPLATVYRRDSASPARP